jgi:hypothetical protein
MPLCGSGQLPVKRRVMCKRKTAVSGDNKKVTEGFQLRSQDLYFRMFTRQGYFLPSASWKQGV